MELNFENIMLKFMEIIIPIRSKVIVIIYQHKYFKFIIVTFNFNLL